ncbi:hypothetical protein Tco_0745725 [Tanacetum coccineum]
MWTSLPQHASFSPEIDTYRAKFRSEFPNQDLKEEFLGWFGSQIRQCYIDKDPCVNENGELFAWTCGPTPSPILVNSCVVNCVSFVVHSRDERRTTQNKDICPAGEKDGEMYYGQLEEILKFSYMSFKFVLFRAHGELFKDDQYILTTQVKQVFYLEDMARRPPDWKVVQDVNHKKVSNGGVIMVEYDHDVIHFDNSFDLTVSTSLNDLDFATLNIDDALPYDLADSDDEDLANNDDDDVAMSADVARGHGGDGGGDDHPPSVPMESSTTREYPYMIHTYFDTHIVDVVFLRDEERLLYEEMLRLKDLGPNTPSGVPYIDDEIMAMVRRGRQRGHIPGVGRVLAGQGRDVLSIPEPRCTHTANADEVKKTNKQLRKEIDMLMKVVRSDDKMSQLLTQLQSQHEVGSGSGSGGGGDDEPGEDEDADKDEDADGDEDC